MDVPVTLTYTPPMVEPLRVCNPPYPFGVTTLADPLMLKFSNPPRSTKARHTVSVTSTTDAMSKLAVTLLVKAEWSGPGETGYWATSK